MGRIKRSEITAEYDNNQLAEALCLAIQEGELEVDLDDIKVAKVDERKVHVSIEMDISMADLYEYIANDINNEDDIDVQVKSHKWGENGSIEFKCMRA